MVRTIPEFELAALDPMSAHWAGTGKRSARPYLALGDRSLLCAVPVDTTRPFTIGQSHFCQTIWGQHHL